MCDWPGWLGTNTQGRGKLDEQSGKLIGCSKAPGTIKTYNRCFKKWAEFRILHGKTGLIMPEGDIADAERGVLRFATLHHGPLLKSDAAVDIYLRPLAYIHRLHTGLNPVERMFRVKLLLQGAKRDEGPPNRKLPASCEDLIEIHRGPTPGCINEQIIYCVILAGWFFMLRKSEYLGPGLQGQSPNTFRHSIRVLGPEAYKDSKRVSRGEDCDSVTLHIHGSKTDWLHAGTVRTHGALPNDRPTFKYDWLGT